MTATRVTEFKSKCQVVAFQTKAIIAMHLLRLTRRVGQKGRGGSRQDHPLFRAVTMHELNGDDLPESIDNEARAAVTKYWRQLDIVNREDAFIADLHNPTITPRMMLERHYEAAVRAAADAELTLHLEEQETAHYGSW